MSYLALARKWRPQRFEDIVGQKPILKALENGLNHQRLHHAYLFTGTRGTGKTTLARLIAKCLNCEKGITSNPCNTCSNCQDFLNNRFVDLLEIDAASRTRVEDTREILENIQYAPTKGRYKIYLIDEVHMLSGHSFNALLKTLEEPPTHVKFLLATTDPEKLPITILSRCLRFHLKPLHPHEISTQLQHILNQEKITYEFNALKLIAYFAKGSMRDALSLLDQAIMFGNGTVQEVEFKSMLGIIPKESLYDLLQALIEQNSEQIITFSQSVFEQNLSFETVLDELLSLLHKISVIQMIRDASFSEIDDLSRLRLFAENLSPETVQLFYQIALIGKKDLPLAPAPQMGFEMILLRMLAFKPENITNRPKSIQSAPGSLEPSLKPAANHALSTHQINMDTSLEQPKKPKHLMNWNSIVEQLPLNYLAKNLAQHCIAKEWSENFIHLLLDPKQAVLLNTFVEKDLQAALQNFFQTELTLKISVANEVIVTPMQEQKAEYKRTKEQAIKSLKEDDHLQKILKTFDVSLQSDNVEPRL